MCEDTADPEVNNVWPWSAQKWGPNGAGAGAKVGAQAYRDDTNIASPRDGVPRDANDAATDTIPNNVESATPDTKETRRFGMHESYDHYDRCTHTERNKGLYTADQRMRRNDQRATRQNPNGNRNGLECPEERDHYPWWQPSPWIDVAVLTNEASAEPCVSVENNAQGVPVCLNAAGSLMIGEAASARCAYYLSESQNKKKKGYCDAPHGGETGVDAKLNHQKWNQRQWPNNKEACLAIDMEWREMSHDDYLKDVAYPVCGMTSFSRVNHLGNAADDETIDSSNTVEKSDGTELLPNSANANRFVWTVPSIPAPETNEAAYFKAGTEEAYKSCTLRLRYNISTSDYAQWPAAAMEPGHTWANEMVNFKNNTRVHSGEIDEGNTPVIQDPYVYTGVGDKTSVGPQFVSLAVNTNQYGRTFQVSGDPPPLPSHSLPLTRSPTLGSLVQVRHQEAPR